MRPPAGRVPRRAGRTVLLGLGLLLAAYLALLGLIYSQQRRLLFPSSGRVASAAEAGLPGFEDVTVGTSDGERLVGWWKPPEPGRAILLYFHGNGGSLWDRRARARLLAQDGRGLLAVSYRGYSGSSGSPSEDGLHRDADAAYAWLGSYAPGRIVLYGESLGTGIAIRLATEKAVAGLILDAPYTSTADVARIAYWFLPVSLLMRDQFRSIDRIARLHVPLLVMHGEGDGVVPVAMSDALFALANEPKRYVRLPGVDHVSVLEKGGLAEVESFVADVERRYGLEPTAAR